MEWETRLDISWGAFWHSITPTLCVCPCWTSLHTCANEFNCYTCMSDAGNTHRISPTGRRVDRPLINTVSPQIGACIKAILFLDSTPKKKSLLTLFTEVRHPHTGNQWTTLTDAGSFSATPQSHDPIHWRLSSRPKRNVTQTIGKGRWKVEGASYIVWKFRELWYKGGLK